MFILNSIGLKYLLLLFGCLCEAKVYSSKIITAKVNANYSCASNVRKDINEDFMEHLDFFQGGFLYKMCVQNFYRGT